MNQVRAFLSILLSLLFFANITPAQDAATDEKYIHLLRIREHSIVEDEPLYGNDLKASGNYKIMERTADGKPSVIRFNYTVGNILAGRWTSVRKGYADIYFKNGLPFATIFNGNGIKKRFRTYSYSSKDLVYNNKAEDFTREQYQAINQYFEGDKVTTTQQSPSYQAVLARHAAYPKEWDAKDKLGIVYILRDNYKFEWVPDNEDDLPYGVVSVGSLETRYEGKVKKRFFRNNSDGPIIIKGIEKRRVESGYLYKDASFKVEAGQMFDYYTIYPVYPDEETTYPLVTYIGDIGKVSNDLKAKEIKPGVLEISAYVNSSGIKVKKGDKITVKVTGEMTFGAFAGKGNAEGINGFNDYNQVEGFRHGAVLGKIGGGSWFLVGLGKTFVADRDGILQFTVNDGEPQNNQGSFMLQYAVNKALQ